MRQGRDVKLFTVGFMKISALLLTAALSLSTAASALTVSTSRVVTLPGADTAYAAALPGGRWAVNADNGVLILDGNLKTQIGWYTLRTRLPFTTGYSPWLKPTSGLSIRAEYSSAITS